MSGTSGQRPPTVFVIDDEEAVRDALSLLIDSVGLAAESFASAAEFLERLEPETTGCLVLDIRMPGMSGLDLQDRLNHAGVDLPIIFITGHADVPMAVRAMRAGAVDFLQKPFSDQELLDRIHEALASHGRRRRSRAERREVEKRLATLTPREREVLDRIVHGEPNKVIANRLGLSQRTVEIHRAHIMHKTRAGSLAALVRMVVSSGADAEPG